MLPSEKIKWRWKNGDYWNAVLDFFRFLPILVFPLGESKYIEIIERARAKYGSWNTLHSWPIILYREIFHFAAGCLVILPYALLRSKLTFFMWVGAMVYVLSNELIFDPRRDGGFFVKNLFDILFWALPGILTFLIL